MYEKDEDSAYYAQTILQQQMEAKKYVEWKIQQQVEDMAKAKEVLGSSPSLSEE